MRELRLVAPTALLLMIVLMVAAPGSCGAVDTDTIPPQLEAWKPWVLHGKEDKLCPPTYNKGEALQCKWPSRLVLTLDKSGGRFSQEWLTFVKDWVTLPSEAGVWPRDVKVDARTMPVVNRSDAPAVFLEPGRHTIEGSFEWQEMPETLLIPAASGLVSLAIDGAAVDFPVIDERGRLWLRKRAAGGGQEDRLDVKVFRLFDDTIPMQVTNLFRLSISGQTREIKLDRPLLDGSIPMSIQSSLPARVGPAGEIVIQGRPGRFEVTLVSRFAGPVSQLGPTRAPYGEETWAFRHQNHLRMVQLEGLPGTDPKQTDAPRDWEQLPTFLAPSNGILTIKELRRGDPEPAPDQLQLKRTWWLDFDGSGYTIQDRIDGTMSRQWALAMNRPEALGRVSIDGVDQLITSQGPDKLAGVELRRGELHLTAESRLERSGSGIPAVGWDHDFQTLSGTLNLPPGWRLLTASGVDVVPGTWFERWSLLDLFLVLIIALATAKLWGWPMGILALAALGLSYHEIDAPRLAWLHVLAPVALLRILPEGWVRRSVGIYRILATVVLIAFSIPFMVLQVRWGIYPQLEPHYAQPGFQVGAMMDHFGPTLQAPPPPPPPPAPAQREAAPSKLARRSMTTASSVAESRKEVPPTPDQAFVQDPKALIQTGPGLPSWSWRSIPMTWNGPVTRDQTVTLRLLPPAVNLLLGFVRVALLALLILVMLDLRQWKTRKPWSLAATAVLLLSLLAVRASAETGCTAYPPQEVLNELQKRLIEPPPCLPQCADIARMEIKIAGNGVTALLELNAATDTAVPLPGGAKSWMPEKVLVDDRHAEGLARSQDGQLWIMAPKGVHRVALVGKAAPGGSFQIPLPLRPHHVRVDSPDWEVQGIQPNGRPDASIQFTRKQKDASKKSDEESVQLPPLLHVERVLSLGITWQVSTTVKRMTPTGTPVTAAIPLVSGESVTTGGIRVENGLARIALGTGADEIRWTGVLQPSRAIQLEAASSGEAVAWTETWVLDASPIWHCEPSGIPVIHHQDRMGLWKPTWKPWPGEKVSINVTRPEGIPGQLTTIDQVSLELTPGERFQKARLSLNIRSSQGGQQPVGLPPNAELDVVLINGKSQPIRQDGRQVVVPLQPGAQSVVLEWRQPGAMGTVLTGPEVTLGGIERAVNATVTFNIPHNRWTLWTGGPRLGPAVLFWSFVLIVVLAALALGRVTWTPLKTYHWLLLGLGLTQTDVWSSILIVGWLLALGVRSRISFPAGWLLYNATQLALVAWTFEALTGLYSAVQKGLLGVPVMQIAGNNSTDFVLNWTQDRIGTLLPQPWVLSLPLMAYRILMLLWALWLALAVLSWLRWGWQCFSTGGFWRKMGFRKVKAPQE
ncbi:MAG: hypothetical protein AB9873_13695 [Syntrophobacteraceae bacterium]